MVFKFFKSKPTERWMADVQKRFPDWPNATLLENSSEEELDLIVGQEVTGEVIADAPMGTWLDIGAPVPALLYSFNRENTVEGLPGRDNRPEVGKKLICRVTQLGNHSDISVTQREAGKLDQERLTV